MGLTILRKRKPQVILFNIDNRYGPEDLKKQLPKQNECLNEDGFDFDFPIPTNKGTCHWVMTVHPDLYHYLDTRHGWHISVPI